MNEPPVFSRPTVAGINGKQTVTLKTMVTDEVAEDVQKFARDRGYGSVSDCIREVLLVTLYGPDYLTDLHRQRIASLVRPRAAIGTVSDETVPGGSD